MVRSDHVSLADLCWVSSRINQISLDEPKNSIMIVGGSIHASKQLLTPRTFSVVVGTKSNKPFSRPHFTVTSASADDIMETLKSFLAPRETKKDSRTRAVSVEDTEAFLQIDNAPTWDALSSIAAEQAKENGFTLPQEEDYENGPPNPVALRRTFGKPDQEPQIKLYRDHAAWCPYCHKVVLQLEEKKIPYVIEKINMRCYGDKPREFLEKVPSGLLPVLEVNGQVITESAVIQQLLEEWFPHPALLPPEGTSEKARALELMRLERQLFGDWLQYLCNGWGGDANRQRFEKTMDEVERALGVEEGPYFLSSFSLVDIIFAPFLERIVASIPYYKGVVVRGSGRWQNLERWFDAMETRPAYMAFKSDFYTHCHDLPPQLGGCASTPEAKEFQEKIDGLDGKSWSLPLEPITSSSLEPLSAGDDLMHARFVAASKLIHNHSAIVRFALRGAGSPGPRPVTAPLADPTAIPNMEYEEQVDAALRHVAHVMLTGMVEQGQHDGTGISTTPSGKGVVDARGVPPSLAYLRDRVGVPRDMPLPAARQLRAHLNWMIDHVQTTST